MFKQEFNSEDKWNGPDDDCKLEINDVCKETMF